MELPKNNRLWINPLQLYLAFSVIAAPLYFLVQRVRLWQGKESATRQQERFGITDVARPAGRLVCFHAATIGESLALMDVIHAVLAEARDIHVVITTQSLNAAPLLEKLLPDRALHQFAPYDTRGAVKRFLKHWRPDVSIWAESELWPRMVQETARRRIPMLIANARVSQDTIARIRRWPSVVRDLLLPFGTVLVQEDILADVLQEAGIPSGQVKVVGALKEDIRPPDVAPETLTDLTAQLAGRLRWLAASTHPNEEAALVAAHDQAFGRGAALMIIAPRHPQRGPEIMHALQAQGWQVALRSRGDAPNLNTQIYIADTLGEMGLWYSLCPVAFVGGSLVPQGGHNPFEPLKLGCAVIHGAEVSNFAGIYQRLDQCGGAILADSTDTVAGALVRLQDSTHRSAVTQAAHDSLQTAASATTAVLAAIREALSYSDVHRIAILHAASISKGHA